MGRDRTQRFVYEASRGRAAPPGGIGEARLHEHASGWHARREPGMNEALIAFLFIGATTLFGVVGVVIGRRLVHGHVAEGHNDVLVPIFLTVGVIYAVLLGFTVVAEWEFYDAAKTNTGEEAALLVPLYRQTRAMDEDKGAEMRHLIRSYAEHV